MSAATETSLALPLTGQVVVVTGRLSHFTRAQAEAEIRRLGGTVGSGVTTKTSLLVVGEDAGSKLAKAQSLGVRVLREEEFRQLGRGTATPTAAPAVGSSAVAASALAAAPRRSGPPAAEERDPGAWAHAVDQARQMLRAWLERDSGRQVYGQRPGDTPEGRAILDAPPLLQVAAIHATLEALRQAPESRSYTTKSEQAAWQRAWKARDLLGALLRRRQPFNAEDIAALVGLLAEAADPWDYYLRAPEILRALAPVTTPESWAPAQREVLQRMLDALPHTYAPRGDRLQRARLLRELLGLSVEGEDSAPGAVELPPQQIVDFEALRREAVAFWDDLIQRATPRGLLGGLFRTPRGENGRELLEMDAARQLAAWEVGLQRLFELADQQRWNALLHPRTAVENALALVPDRGLAAIAAEVAGVLERLPEVPGLWDDSWYAREPLARLFRRIDEDGLARAVRPQLRGLRERMAHHAGRPGVRGLILQLDLMLAEGRVGPVEAVDAWGYAAQAALDGMAEPLRTNWISLLVYAGEGTGSKPARRWLERARPLVKKLGAETHLELTGAWLDLLKEESPVQEQVPRETYGYTRPDVLTETNTAILRGLVWLSTLGETRRFAPQLAAAAVRCFQKVPGTGPRAIAVGNACLYALGALDPMESIPHFQAVRYRVTYLPALKIIDTALEQAAQRAGMGREDLEDLGVPGFGLVGGARREQMGAYTAELRVEPARAELRWSRAGAPLASEPAALRREFPEDVKALKVTLEDVRRQLPVQRQRLESALMTGRTWAAADWRARCFDHPLLSVLARRLIWCFEGPEVQVGAWDGQKLVDVEDHPLGWPAADARVRLWHPIGWEPARVLAWRDWLERHEVTQPFKQAHREVYLLTDAELRTRTYSNRYAAHLLRQHQIHALAQQRGWKAPLAMIHDGGWDTQLTLAMAVWDLEAAYFISCVYEDGNPDAGYNDNGVCLLVSGDQVRFRRLGASAPLPLTDVPALAFSEVMRDVDLFVGVASLGADPTWFDRGNAQQQAYWQRFSFGDLGESAKTRRQVLERLLPRLRKLDGRWQLADRFLVVRGELRTYKIHLGSGNILMSPNDQYLCIVPDRRTAGGQSEGTFLPFEGDSTLAVILSKALLLAEDKKITDPSITRQLRG
jgi:hypothetical protein